MKAVGTHTLRPVKVIQNTTRKQAKYAIIKDARTGERLHTGEPNYIRRVAAKRYNVVAQF
jgi:hypothetical protein